MHELAIAQQLIETAAGHLPASASGRVRTVHVGLGLLAGVSADELRFGFDVVSVDTPLAGARLEIVEIPVVVRCAACQTDSTVAAAEFILVCPLCKGTALQVLQGKELTLDSFEVDDDTAGS